MSEVNEAKEAKEPRKHRILYVAKHDSGGNDDEGSITHALTSLGHEVITVNEHHGYLAIAAAEQHRPDFLLFHKWCDTGTIRKINVPKVFWYFDLVDTPDGTLIGRCRLRKAWMAATAPLVNIGFCTDGDWVNRGTYKNLQRLTQGFDSRLAEMARGARVALRREPKIVFTGIQRGGGVKRVSFVHMMTSTYHMRFHHVQNCHRHELISLMNSAAIVVAPDGPVTDNYWSNRVYNAIGMGAFLLHPYCETLTSQYRDREEIVFYRDRDQLHDLIEFYLDNEAALKIAAAGQERTLREHTYTNRVSQLLQVVEDQIGI